jgi:dCTP deaminase
MSALVDYQIKTLAKAWKMISPYQEAQLNPASYDVTIGSKVLIEKPVKSIISRHSDDRWLEIDIFNKPYSLEPGEFVLASTAELLTLPDNIEAVFCLKSSRGREGWEHALAGYIDPGFSGRITLELKNNSRYYPLELSLGLKIGQIRFSKLNDKPHKPYNITGRYHNDQTTTPSKG